MVKKFEKIAKKAQSTKIKIASYIQDNIKKSLAKKRENIAIK